MCPLSTAFSLYGLYFLPYIVQCRSYSKKTVNQIYNYSTVLGAAIKCKPYSEITVEIGTYLKAVKITLNIFSVLCSCALLYASKIWFPSSILQQINITKYLLTYFFLPFQPNLCWLLWADGILSKNVTYGTFFSIVWPHF